VKKTRFSEEQMVTIRADRREAPPAARAGNGRLKKMVADRDLEIDVLKEITRKKW
jgi:hypothetical protein